MAYFIDNGKVYDTEYDYAIMLAKEIKKIHKDATTTINIDFIISTLGHGKNLVLARTKKELKEGK